MALFRKKTYAVIPPKEGVEIKKELWERCPSCKVTLYEKTLRQNLFVCPKCNFHFRLGAKERLKITLDEGSFQEMAGSLSPLDPLNFEAVKSYKEKIKESQEKTGILEAAIIGEGEIEGKKVVVGVTDSNFIMGSMGSVVGEKISRAAEIALEKRIPLLTISGSGGGARMYEGMLSLMQMAKTSAAISRLKEGAVPFISLLTDPTMAGVAASFAFLGDIIIAEPKALIGFTGPRVIEQTIKTKLPEGFQRSEFLFEHGMIDLIVQRKELRPTLSSLLSLLSS